MNHTPTYMFDEVQFVLCDNNLAVSSSLLGEVSEDN